MTKLIDANGTQAALVWSQIDWQKIEKTVLRLQHRIFMAKVKGDVKGMESLQRLLASSRAAKLLAIRKVGQENSGRKTPGIDGVVSISDADRERLKNGFNCGCIFSKAFRCAITGLRLRIPPKSFSTTLSQDKLVTPTIGATSVLFTKRAQAHLRTRARGDQIMASLKDVPFSGL